MPLEAIFLDFDGVVLESLDIKTGAFRKLFAAYPKQVDAIVKYHMENSGVSRYEKFAYFYEKLLGQKMPAGEMEKLDAKFGDLVWKEILRCDFVPGCLDFLEKYSRRVPLFVVSATPEKELHKIVEARGLRQYFKGIYGSPKSKVENIKFALAKSGYSASQAVFIGDGTADFEAAREVGIPFIARSLLATREFWAKKGVQTIPDLRGLPAAIGLPA